MPARQIKEGGPGYRPSLSLSFRSCAALCRGFLRHRHLGISVSITIEERERIGAPSHDAAKERTNEVEPNVRQVAAGNR